MVSNDDKALFKKLKISTILDLALIVPSGYDDTTLSSRVDIGETITAKAVVLSVQKTYDRFSVSFDLLDLNKKINAIFFKATPYHHALFVQHSTHYIQGKVTQYNGVLQISQPKKNSHAKSNNTKI